MSKRAGDSQFSGMSSSARGQLKSARTTQKIKKSPSELIAESQQLGLVRQTQEVKPKITSFLNLGQYSHHTESVVPVDEPLFKPSPSVIEFIDFEGLQTYDATLYLRNQDNVARRVKVLPPDSAFFEVLPGKGRKKNSAGDKVAPGMEVSYIIRFKPDARIDYSYDLMIITEREKFMVPIRATGGSAVLEFPDVIDFGATPVKYESERTVLVRNIGDKPSKFLLKTSPPFSTSVLDGYLEVNAAMQVDVLFKPDRAEPYEKELVLKYGDGVEAYVTLRGSAENVNVAFSHRHLVMDDTYIALSTQNEIKIHNHSDVPVDFSWRAFPTVEEEIAQKLKLQVQLKQEEAEEKQFLQQMNVDEEFLSEEESDPDPDSSEEEEDELTAKAEKEKKMEGQLQRRYRNIAKAIMEDPMFFYDEIFAIEPLSGRIWAKSSCSVAISFTPKAALNYQCVAYCSIVGSAERVPLLLKGQGIGPKAAFSYDELDVGDIFVESMHRYEVDLLNQGDIAVNFKLVPNTSPFGSKFQFIPSDGRLEVGGQCTIAVEFCPDLLGEFHETFYWDLVGSASSIPVTFKGHSVSPTFHFDVDRISFGVVSYGFLNSKTLTLTNTSEVPMRFALRIPGDGRFLQKEFDVIPPRGTLLPNCSQKVQIDFISVNVKTYDLCLVVDLDGVGQELASIPIQARCAVPTVSFEPQDTLQYKEIFIRYPFHQTLVLHNTSALPAKFQILPQDDQTRVLAEFEPDQSQGSVPPASSHVVTLTLTSKKIGPVQIPMYVRILGHNVPYPITLTATSIGPRVNVEPLTVDWGSVKCLDPVTRHVRLTNDSCIDASVRAFMKTKNSLWTVEPKSIHLSPQETMSLALTLTIDETTRMGDLVHLVVHEGKDLTVNVRAKGTDTPVCCKDSLETIDFKTQYTTQTHIREFTIENRGRKQRKLVWVPEKGEQKKKKGEKDAKEEEEEEPPIFSVYPEAQHLNGKTAFRFQFIAVCPKPGVFSETYLCQEFAGNERKGTTVFRTELRGDFVAPLLEHSAPQGLQWRFLWDKNQPISPMSKKLSIVNISPLDVKFYIKIQPPFSVDTEECTLEPSGRTEIRVDFDPGFKVDRVCGVAKQKLTILYENHPQKDTIDLTGEVIFPNVKLNTTMLDFGSVLNETTKQMSVTISNKDGVLPVHYHWSFVEETEMNPDEYNKMMGTTASLATAESDSLGKSQQGGSMQNTQTSGFGIRAGSPQGSNLGGPQPPALEKMGNTAGSSGFGVSTGKDEVDINQIFDILPVRGRLEPGAEATTTFTYFGVKNQKFDALAVCSVEGGPEYEVTLKGQASRLEFRLDKNELDFGEIPFNQVFEKEVYISNPGKVSCYYNFNLTGVSRPFVLDASPLSGLIHPDEKHQITIKFRAGIPDEVCETALLEVAHFEPSKLVIRGRGIFPGVVMTTKEGKIWPRLDEEDHKRRKEIARAQIISQTKVEEVTDQTSLAPPTQGDAITDMGGTATDQLQLAEGETQLAVLEKAKEPSNLDIEFEIDRNYLCEVLLEKEKQMTAPVAKKQDPAQTSSRGFEGEKKLARMSTTGMSGASQKAGSSKGMGGPKRMKELPPMTAAYYLCDFGHIVLGHSRERTIRIHNCYTEPVSFTINRKMLFEYGYTIEPEQIKKIAPGEKMELTITSFRSKEAEEGAQRLDWVVPLKGGPLYEISLVSDFVLPDLWLSSDAIDFSHVLVGQRKRITMKLKNNKAVPVEWAYKEPRNKYGKRLPPWEVVFNLSTKDGLQSGTLMPNESIWLEVSFTPNSAKPFHQKLALRIKDNPNKKLLTLRGQGDALRVEVQPSTSYQLGPVLPYDDNCTQEIFLYNPTDYPIEVYSVDFDNKYVEEEDQLKRYDKYIYEEFNLTELDVRAPGEDTWAAVKKRNDRLQLEADYEAKLQAQTQAQEAGEEVEELAALPDEEVEGEEQDDFNPEDFPIRVLAKDRLHAVILGPPQSGKTSVANALAEKTGRKVLTIDEAVSWALSGPKALRNKKATDLLDKLRAVIESADTEFEIEENNRQQEAAKAKKTFVPRPHPEYPIEVEDIRYILEQRTEQPDYNCGVIIDGVTSKYLSKTEDALAASLTFCKEKIEVRYMGLQGSLGFDAKVDLGEGAAVISKLTPSDEVPTPEGLPKVVENLKEYYAGLGKFLTAHLEELRTSLTAAQEELEQLPEDPPPAEPAPAAEGEDPDETMREPPEIPPEELERQAKKEELTKRIAKLQKDIETCEKSSAKLEEPPAEEGQDKEETIASDMVTTLTALEKIVAMVNEQAKADEAQRRKDEAGAKKATKKRSSNSNFKPPPREDMDAGMSSGAENLGATASSVGDMPETAFEAPICLCPMPLDKAPEGEGVPFQQAKEIAQDGMAMPIIPLEPPLPPPSFCQLVQRPQTRPPKVKQANFSILTPVGKELGEETTDGDGTAAADPPGADGGAAQPETTVEQHRWIIPPGKQQRLLCKFFSKNVDTFSSTLTFEVVGGINGNAPTTIMVAGMTAFPAINSDPRNVFMRRTKALPAIGYANKQFITSLNKYDFGPLLAGRDKNSRELAEGEEGAQHVKQHVESLRITNNSLFKAKVHFCLASSRTVDGNNAKVSAKAKAAPKPENGPPPEEQGLLPFPTANFDDYPFIVEPDMLELEIDQTQDVRIWCFPTKEGTFADTLIVTTEHNPEAVTFPISAIGAVPKVAVQFPNPETEEVDFDRLLLRQKDARVLKITNSSAVPVQWKLVCLDETGIPEPFIFDHLEGEMGVNDERSVVISFRADEAETYQFGMKLVVQDTQGLKPPEDVKKFEVKAEAFEVVVYPEFDDAGTGLDFQDLRVGTPAEKTFNVVNKGKYPVKFQVKVRRQQIRSILTIEPDGEKKEGEPNAQNYFDKFYYELEPNAERKVHVKCTPAREMTIPDPRRPGRNGELDLLVFEAQSGELVRLDLPPITLSLRSHFNQFSVTPPRGLNFGPVKMGEHPAPERDFEIRNEGIFNFEWYLFDPTQHNPDAGTTGGKPTGNDLKIGPFTISPAHGTLDKKASKKVLVRFDATDDKDHDCKIGIHVDGTAETMEGRLSSAGGPRLDDPSALMNTTQLSLGGTAAGGQANLGFRDYLLTGQSCVPGIDTKNMAIVFEEQFVARNLEDAIMTAGRMDIRVYCEEDNVFSFGPVVAQGGDAKGDFAAKFRITNPKAIPCEVKLDIKPKGGAAAAAGKGGAGDVLPFELSTKELHIPAHEYRYVKVPFKPPYLQTYSAIFEAIVPANTSDDGSNKLIFELRGDGTVPTVSLEGPPIFGDSGGVFNFGKLQKGRSHEVSFLLRNDGIIPAMARCDIQPKHSPHFTVTCPTSTPLEPKEQQPFIVKFHPVSDGDFEVAMRLYTLHNPYEDTTIKIQGCGYADEVSWDLQDVAQPDADPKAPVPPEPDELNLGEVALGSEVSATFYVTNTAKDPIRFSFPETIPAEFKDSLVITPSVGHVAAKSKKAITFTFTPKEKCELQKVSLPCTMASIKYEGVAEDWDDSMKIVRSASKDQLESGELPPAAGEGEGEGGQEDSQNEEKMVKEEPAHHIIEGSTRDLPLKVSVIADPRIFECDTNVVRFTPTVMFHTKVFRFPLRNPSRISLPYQWVFSSPDSDVSDKRWRDPKCYTITPKFGTIEPGGEQEFVLRFSPTEIENYNSALEAKIPDVTECRINGEVYEQLKINLSAQATRPWCHFEVPASDYRSRRQSDAPLDPKYQILEFQALGTKVKNTKRFYVLNPTAEAYDFNWMPEADVKAEVGDQPSDNPFRCITKRGTILPGKKYEMVFEYVPMSVGTHESFWTFSILGKDVMQPFLAVGSVKEPRVGFDQPNINFSRLLLGARARETVHIVNKEHIPFSFSFDKASFQTEGQVPVLAVSPASGVVGPGGSMAVEIVFKPAEEKMCNFNVKCNVKRKAEPVMINVKGEGYKIHTRMLLEMANQAPRVINPGVRELLDFGTLQVHERRKFTLKLTNPRREDTEKEKDFLIDPEERPNVNFDFVWQLKNSRGGLIAPSGDAAPFVIVSPLQGVAEQEKEMVITIEYAPLESHSLDGSTLKMLIPSGPGDASYSLELSGRARKPNVDFSVTNHDFGHCFVKRAGATTTGEPTSPSRGNTPYERLDLVCTNRDLNDCLLSTTFQKTPYLDVQLVAHMIEAGQSLTIPIIFTPRDYVEYREQIEFIINDFTKMYVNIKGRGCQLRLEVASMNMQNVDFGVTTGNQPVQKSVKLINRSQKEVEFTLSDPEGHLAERSVSWNPAMRMSLRPRETVPVDLYFTPNYRVAPFKLPLHAQTDFGDEIHLLNVAGICHATEIRLSEHSLLFGDVVVQSVAVQKVRLHNFGDMGSKFRFEMPPKVASMFSVEPKEGFIAPHDDIVLQVSFHPTQAKENRPMKIRCVLDSHEPVELMVQGRGIDQPGDWGGKLSFQCDVREKAVQTFMFPPAPLNKNPTSETWKLHPVVKTEVPDGVQYWSVPSEISIGPGEQLKVEVTYHPLTMTPKDEGVAETDDKRKSTTGKQAAPTSKHLGKVFIATPDGSAFVYELEGIANAPSAAKKIEAEVPCKTPHVQGVTVSNWLRERQKFDVQYTLIEPADAHEEIKIHGAEKFDLPPDLTREYKLNVFAYKEGSALVRILFTNPQTREYMTVDVDLKFTTPKTLQTIKFNSACRQAVRHPINIANPLSTPVAFKCESSHAEIRFLQAGKPVSDSNPFVVPPVGDATLDVQFRPVLEGTGEATVTLTSPELGAFPYTMEYVAKAAGLEKTMTFKAPLGGDVIETFKFLHYARKPANYTASIGPAPGRKGPISDFVVESKDIKANPSNDDGNEVGVDIRFTPSNLTEVRALLILSSPDGGEYKALLVGYAQPPQPQGPVVVQAGKGSPIEFRNPFDVPTEFTFQLDNPCFTANLRSQKIDPKKSLSVQVNYKPDNPGKEQGGRLIVNAPGVATPWIYFLKGTN